MADDSLPLLHFKIHTDNKFTTFRLPSVVQDVTAWCVTHTKSKTEVRYYSL